jgi:hypothetical protein
MVSLGASTRKCKWVRLDPVNGTGGVNPRTHGNHKGNAKRKKQIQTDRHKPSVLTHRNKKGKQK